MFEKCSILRGRDRFDQIWRNVVIGHRLSAAVSLGGDRTEDLGFDLCLVDLRIGIPITDGCHRFLIFGKLDRNRRKYLFTVDCSRCAWFDR